MNDKTIKVRLHNADTVKRFIQVVRGFMSDVDIMTDHAVLVSKIMGHANITITMKKYIHVLQEEEAKAMSMVKVC